jgi:hypothetical protein
MMSCAFPDSMVYFVGVALTADCAMSMTFLKCASSRESFEIARRGVRSVYSRRCPTLCSSGFKGCNRCILGKVGPHEDVTSLDSSP